MSFAEDDLARIRDADEIDIETQPPDGPPHRTTIWIVVEGDDVFVRSVRGERGRWYREALANPAVAIHVDGRRLPATAIPATDPDSIDRVTRAVIAKYAGIDGYDSMQNPQIFASTLRLEPA
jgi:hypothetical protein